MSEKNYKNQIEALLFASGRFMDANTLLLLTGASGKQVLINNVRKLKEEYDERESPLMVVEEKDGWKLTVRETYLSLVRKIISETELPKTILETLAIIAWRSPVLQSEVVNIRHNKAYEHISELVDLGFIRKETSGRSYLLNLTEKFYEYFDVDGSKDIREVFNKVVGSPPQTKVDDFERNIIGDLANANIAATKISESIEHSEKNYEETKNIDEEDEEFSEL
ncbi:SMC-Scp complex subunit ScpB [archaeon]|jgi:segregation and condensation protein B|nr:SMC-Scp complex subunit ScpB [archaeon]MBT4460670.1 SMC-Scp complex subunit ScpB [archaeon]MBT4857958.1 SMC-Scp complex subunit ScpB [archaeon]MBT5423407.1 SMC-Scp complex subunit ScpB [archaeon]MBT6773623.1 SMC-Scp complex subunit ScpB [archaeon]